MLFYLFRFSIRDPTMIYKIYALIISFRSST